MITDLYSKSKSKKQQLLEYIKARKEVKTHEVIAWGLDNRHIRADRDCRDLAREGKICRLSKEEKDFRYWHCKEDVWRYI
jgi:hypothetical protein